MRLAPEDAHRLERLATLRKEQQVWEHERGFEISKRDYLGNDVLKTPGSAVVWRLAQDHHDVNPGVKLAIDMFGATDSGQRSLFRDQLARLVEKYGQQDIADRIRRDLGAAFPGSPPPSISIMPETDRGSPQLSDVDTLSEEDEYLHLVAGGDRLVPPVAGVPDA